MYLSTVEYSTRVPVVFYHCCALITAGGQTPARGLIMSKQTACKQSAVTSQLQDKHGSAGVRRGEEGRPLYHCTCSVVNRLHPLFVLYVSVCAT